MHPVPAPDDAATGSDGPAAAPAAAVVEVVGVVKRFGAIVANDGIDLSVTAGEVHALLGENGAGKSTLTRMLYGLSQPDAGEIRMDGRAVRFTSPKDAIRAGIGLVTQEFSLVGPMTVTENVMLATIGLGIVDRRGGRARVLETAERIGVRVDPDAPVESLSVGERQRVEILKALHHGCRVLILDEPTAVLVPQDVDALFATIRRLAAGGMGVVFISHKLHEVVAIADRITVLRRGRHVVTQRAAGLDPARIATLMIGAELARRTDVDDLVGIAGPAGRDVPNHDVANHDVPNHDVATDDVPTQDVPSYRVDVASSPVSPPARHARPALDIRSLSLERAGVRVLDDVAITVEQGEIVGVAGVSGNGQTELVSVLCAMVEPTSGSIHVAGTDVTDLDPVGRIDAGLGRITGIAAAASCPA